MRLPAELGGGESDVEYLPLEWKDIIGDRTVDDWWFCSFELGEGGTALFLFSDGTCEVGHGEPLRPYTQLYKGTDQKQAMKTFLRHVRETLAL